ncbi:DUF485 domain-containing protein [Streptomyces alboflavus]|uniref:DUF485 domain-containing protein n=1 Tax=Streptomyces alboflavus TaxID=67267 RepID=A0A1Z1WCD8_9ACTN|nr:DUF485 domain-containing protein [Streptomyces alboflavus]ARX84032.1 hypothetical protein SMD44_03466 [Streptomyces alboflavus]
MTHPPHDATPHLPPHRHTSSPSYATYPWQPVPPPPAPPPPRAAPRHPALGNHRDLRVLRTAYRRQRRVATLTALGYFTLFLILSGCAPSLMNSEVSGGLTTGLLLGLVQLPVMCLAIALYEFTARRRLDQLAARLRKLAELEANRDHRR